MSTEGRDGEHRRKRQRRTANACLACRQSKIKCSGIEPCMNCQRRFIHCRFDDDARVTVTERYLQNLRRQAGLARPYDISNQAWQQQRTVSQSLLLDEGPLTQRAEEQARATDERSAQSISQYDDVCTLWTSPFTGHFRTIRNTHKNRRSWIWLAPTSTWSFTARLILLLEDKLGLDSATEQLPSLSLRGEEVYSLQLDEPRGADLNGVPDISGLPSVDYALYLLRTVRFHFGQTYHLIEEDSFLADLNEFYYKNAAEKAASSRLWFVQFLIVLAFGNAFLMHSAAADNTPGSLFFSRAMALMPDHLTLWKDSIVAIEVSALAGLYLYSVDKRDAAHVYLGQAIRLAQLEGLHVQLPEEELGSSTILRCRKLWWSLYIMDRHFSSSLGVPTIINDNDTTAAITSPLSTSLHERISPTLKLHVKLSRLDSHILATIYKETRAQLDSFLESTRDILHCLAEMAQEIEHIVSLKITNLVDSISKETSNVALLYHQCVIKATRPLLLSVLKERLESLRRNGDGEDWENFLSKTQPLISEGIRSAIKTVDIMSSDETLLQMFLPFDLEYTFGAALHLAMANVLFPDLEQENQACFNKIQGLMDRMIRRGNKLAGVRKQELSHLELLLSELSKRTSQRGFTTWTLNPLQAAPLDSDSVIRERQPNAASRSTGGRQVRGEDSNKSPSASAIEIVTYPTPGQTTTSVEMAPAAFLGEGSGGSLSAPSPAMPLDSGQDFLASIGISSENFFSIVDQMNQLESCLDIVAPDS